MSLREPDLPPEPDPTAPESYGIPECGEPDCIEDASVRVRCWPPLDQPSFLLNVCPKHTSGLHVFKTQVVRYYG